MKKKSYKIITVLLLAVCLFLSFSACKAGGNETHNGYTGEKIEVKPNPYTLSGTNVFEDGCYMLMDFETYWEVVQPVWGRSFGKVTMITDPEYVTHGKQSVKLEILGTEYWVGRNVQPLLYLETYNQYFQKKDFSDCDYFAFDIYNALDVDNWMRWSMEGSSGGVVADITLHPGWNHVKIDLESEQYAGTDLSDVDSFWVFFNRGEVFEETQVFYLDNVRAHKKA